MHVETLGSGPRLVLVHGSVAPGWMTWNAQKPLAASFTLVVPIRSGYPPNPPLTSIDFEVQARELRDVLEPGDHLVGHSYGGVVALLTAARNRSQLGSLTVLEPPCTRVALDDPEVAAFARVGAELYARGRTLEPEPFLRLFLTAVGSDWDPPSPLPPELEQGVRALQRERGPWEADIPVADLAALGVPTLVVSGAHHPAFDAICDALERGLGAERVVVPGFGHNPQLSPVFTRALLDFVARAAARSSL
jgi:pimeloyl-ACP methyl ester carboxylesterase